MNNNSLFARIGFFESLKVVSPRPAVINIESPGRQEDILNQHFGVSGVLAVRFFLLINTPSICGGVVYFDIKNVDTVVVAYLV